jgi:Tubulin binding cofactor C
MFLWGKYGRKRLYFRADDVSFLLSNVPYLFLATIRYAGIREFHMVNVSHSTIRMDTDKISGAIHVTQCHNVQLQIHSFHQLRIHESSNLQCHISHGDACGGIILEDSSLLVFAVKANKEKTFMENGNILPLLDVKDFNWLRNNIPSPNFRVEVAIDNEEEELTTSTKGAISSDPKIDLDTVDAQIAIPIMSLPEQDEESDDEL